MRRDLIRHSGKPLVAWFFALLACCAVGSAQAGSTVLYVDGDAPGPVHDGATWATAFQRLDDALAAAAFPDVIVVAQGQYTPDPTGLSDPRDATFELVSEIPVFGGFAGFGAPDPDAFDPETFVTVLSGDLNGDDTSGGDRSENCYHVVTAVNVGPGTLLEGFTITGGHADGIDADSFVGRGAGGGLFSIGTVTVRHCRFVGNVARFGGGMWSYEASPEIESCVFERNVATFDTPSERRGGGALGLFGTDDPVPPGEAGGGGVAHGTPAVRDCVFVGNVSARIGGAVWVDGVAENPTFEGCRFIDNRAVDDGGAVWNGGGFAYFNNCLLRGNSAGGLGGAVYSDTITNVSSSTFADNHAQRGGGLYSAFFGIQIIDSILWGNTATMASGETAQIVSDGIDPFPDYSCIEDYTGAWGGAGMIATDPLFTPGALGCYYLSQTDAGQGATSPCVNAGSSAAADLGMGELATRSDNVADTGVVDIGYHFPPAASGPLAGDFDFDQSIDLSDVAGLQACFVGADAGGVVPCCRVFDFEPDGDVDLDDYEQFQAALTAP